MVVLSVFSIVDAESCTSFRVVLMREGWLWYCRSSSLRRLDFLICFFVLFDRRDFGGFVLCDGGNDPVGAILGLLFEVVMVLCPGGLLWGAETTIIVGRDLQGRGLGLFSRKSPSRFAYLRN